MAGLQVGSGFIKIHADVDEAQRKIGHFADTGGGAFSRLGGVGAAAFGVVAAGAGAALGFGLKIAKDAESAKIGFETMLGSGQKADAFLKQLKDFAAKTPFEFPELRESASRLLAVGTNAKDVIPIMSALGDATAGMGTGSEGISRAVTALSQMQQKGKVTGEEMLQLTEAGIPAWDSLATVMGVSVPEAQEAVTKGQVKVNTLMEAIQSRAGPAFQRLNGLMDKQSQSLEGMVSTLKDSIGELLGGLVGPLLPTIKNLVGAIAPVLTGLVKALAPAMEAIATALGPVLVDVMKALTPVIKGIATAFAQVMVALLPLLPPIAQLIGALAPILPLLAQLIVALLQLAIPVLVPLITLFSGLVEIVVKVIEAALKPLIGFLGKDFSAVINVVMGILKALGGFFGAIFGGIWDVVRTIGGAIGGFLGALWNGIFAVVRAVWGGITGFLSGLWNGILGAARGIFGAISGFIGGVWSGIRDFAIGVWNGISGAIRGIWDGIRNTASAVFNGINNAISGAWNWLRNTASGIWNGIRDAIMGPINSARDGIERALGAIRRAWENVKDAISGAITAIIRRIKDLPFVPGSPIPMVVWAQQTARGVTDALGQMDLPDLANARLPAVIRPAVAGGVAGDAATVAAGSGPGGTTTHATIIVELDGRMIARAIGEPLVDEIRLKTGMRRA